MTLAERRPAYLLADKGYDTDAIRGVLHEGGIRAVIPPRSHRKTPIRWSRRIYCERNRIERMIGHLKVNRVIATRYDKLARSFLDALRLAAIRRCLHLATLQTAPRWRPLAKSRLRNSSIWLSTIVNWRCCSTPMTYPHQSRSERCLTTRCSAAHVKSPFPKAQ